MFARLAIRNASLTRANTNFHAKIAVRAASTADVWGRDEWRFEKEAFKKWVVASGTKGSIEERQMYAYLAASFGDCDVDKSGFINFAQFDRLLENVAALPRRWGYAPSWRAEYGTIEKRHAARKAMFDAIDGAGDHKPRGKIAMAQFVHWAKAHIAGKTPTLADCKHDVALRHLEHHTEKEFLEFLDDAVNKKKSGASASLYNYLLTIFVEADEACKGYIHFDEFNKLIDLAAASPRFFGLAPDTQDVKARRAMFDAMDKQNTGSVTFRKFLRFNREHIRAKLAAHAAKA